MRIASDGSLTGTEFEKSEVSNFFVIHGWLMWAAWGILGFLQLTATRYITPFWKVHMWIHRVTGIIILVITLVLGIMAIKEAGNGVVNTGHNVIGIVVIIMVGLTTLEGFFTRFWLNYRRWSSIEALRAKLVHRVTTYFMILNFL